MPTQSGIPDSAVPVLGPNTKTFSFSPTEVVESSRGWSRVTDNSTDTQKIALCKILIPAGTLANGGTIEIAHYWEFPLANAATKSIFLAIDDAVNSTSSIWAANVNSSKAFDTKTKIRSRGDVMFSPNQIAESGASNNPPVTLTVKDPHVDHYLCFYCFWVSNQAAGTDSVTLSSFEGRVIK